MSSIMELELRRNRIPEVYKQYVRENFPDKDENFLYYNVVRTDLISEYLLCEEPDANIAVFGYILKYAGIDPGDYNLIKNYNDAIRNIRAEVSTYNRYVEESGLDLPFLEVVVDRTQTGINHSYSWSVDFDADYDYEAIDDNKFGRLRTYKVIEKQRSEGL